MADTELQDDPSAKQKRKILDRACSRRKYSEDRDKENRDNQDADTRFVYTPGATWDAAIRAKRQAWGDPCLEFPQLKQFVNQVVNQQRQNRPAIKVHPASGDASVQVADILKGMIRVIEYDSSAEAIYDCAFLHAVVGGRGYLRVTAEYNDDKSFDQSLRLKRISNPNAVRLDPDFEMPDGSDRNWGFVEEAVHKDEWDERFPGFEPMSYGEGKRDWWDDEDHVIIADYYERVCDKRTLVAMQGSVGYLDDLKKTFGEDFRPPTNSRVREVDVYRIDWYTIAGGEQILETHVWPGTIIPIVCVMGDEITVDGKRVYQGLISQAKSSQALFNYGMTNQAIHLALTPRAPYVAAIGQVDEFKEMWENANNRNYSVLTYQPVTVDGNLAPPPQRTAPSSPDAGWINWTQQMTMLMKSTIGMYGNNLGMPGQEVSGKAINARTQQGDNATYHYADNLGRAIALVGRIFIECIPYYYDTQRIVHIIGEDDKRRPVTINEAQPAPPPQPQGMQLGQMAGMPQMPGGMPGMPGQPMPPAQQPDPMLPALQAIAKNDVRVGTYAVTVASGPGYQTKRMEAADLLMQLVQAAPQIMQVAPDLVVKVQDIPDVEALAERFRITLPPQIQAAIAAKEAGQDPQVASLLQQNQQGQQQLQQLQQQIGQLQQQLQQEQADKSANIAASNARKAVAEASGQADAQRLQHDTYRAELADMRTGEKHDISMQQLLDKRFDDQEKRAIERDAVIVDLVKVIQTMKSDQAKAEVAVAGQAIKGQE